jgi:hypothetical protein
MLSLFKIVFFVGAMQFARISKSGTVLTIKCSADIENAGYYFFFRANCE